MVSLRPILAMVTLVATIVDYVVAHGYFTSPKTSFIGNKENSGWIAQISPVWKGDWDSCTSDKELVAMFKKLAPANNFKNLRTLMDGDPLYGKECGYTDPKAKPVDAPTNGQAVFSRAIKHAGMCQLYVNDVLAYSSDDCQASAGNGIIKPVDYSSCSPSGCMFRFYWLALQRLGTKTVWQSYKYCIPLKGPPGGRGAEDASQKEFTDVSQAEPSANLNVSLAEVSSANESKDSKKKPDESKDATTKSDESKDSKKNSDESKDSKKKPDESNDSKKKTDESKDSKKDTTQTPSAGGPPQTPPTEAPHQTPPSQTPESRSAFLPSTPAMTPSPGSKCKGRRRRRY